MGNRSKDKIKALIAKDISDIYSRCMEVNKSINDNLEETLDYLNALIAQIPQSACGPLITKTPKVLRKRGAQRIETIPENEIVNISNVTTDSIVIKVGNQELKTESAEEILPGRKKREASRKAADIIKRQQSLGVAKKLRRPSSFSEDNEVRNNKRESRNKRKKSTRSSSDEESSKGPAKVTKIDEIVEIETVPENADLNVLNRSSIKENTTLQQNTVEASESPPRITRSNNRKRTFSQIQNSSRKRSMINDDTVIAPVSHDIEEPSIYEDVIEKSMPIMNSTMNFNSTYTMQRLINATVVLEPLSAIQLNETVTLNKQMTNNTAEKKAQSKTESKSTRSSSSKSLQDRMEQLKEAMANKEFDELLTEDESSPEIKKPRPNTKTKENTKRQKRAVRSSIMSSEDEVLSTPAKPTLKELNTVTAFHEIKSAYKPNALFSPYAKESVKKRVKAFEQVGNSPKSVVNVDVPTRVTRTKTRAQAAAQAEMVENAKPLEKTITHKLARKSLAKAKKISLAKQAKDTDDCKENKIQAKQQILLEKINQKTQKTTPLTKVKTQLPTSVSRIPQTPLSNQINTNHMKASSATRINIITSMDSFLQPPKSVNKRNSEDKKRKLNDDDARKKREEALRLQTEEKRRKRQEKELKNKLAREAKEKQDMEKRQKAEREREEKARLAQQVMEKQREELEKKRMAQLQRAQEKEEKRKQEEQLRLQRLREQEEAERMLAEQKRREQEAEKRKEMETRVQQQTAAEAIRVKNQMLGSKYGHKHHGPTNYILDSEPDEDESDDETKPKHVIPYWAHPQVRKVQLAMQRYIPEKAIFKFFGSRKCTPDLTELFQGIDKSRLKRTSSAIWRTPPRFSMMETERE